MVLPAERRYNIEVTEDQKLFTRDLDPKDVFLVKKKTFNGGYSLPLENLKLTEHVYKIKNFDHSKKKDVDTFVFITKLTDPNNAIPPSSENHELSNGINPPFCCNYISDGARWYESFSYQVDVSNNLGISSSYVNEVVQNSISHIDSSTPEFQIHSSFTNVVLPSFIDPNVPDGLNTISFGIINLSGVLAVAITHIQGVSTPEIIEADIIFNEQFDLGDSQLDSNKYDLWSITLHELGHGVGLDHVPTESACSGSTMFPSIGRGETNKRTFTSDDQQCVRALYDDDEIALPSSGISVNDFMDVFVYVFIISMFVLTL